MVDFSKPLELMDGTPVVVVGGPDSDGDYTVEPVDGQRIAYGSDMLDTLTVGSHGRVWTPYGYKEQRVRNCAEPTPETLTLRDQFAMAALTAVMSCEDPLYEPTPEFVANRAYRLADAMLTARKGD